MSYLNQGLGPLNSFHCTQDRFNHSINDKCEVCGPREAPLVKAQPHDYTVWRMQLQAPVCKEAWSWDRSSFLRDTGEKIRGKILVELCAKASTHLMTFLVSLIYLFSKNSYSLQYMVKASGFINNADGLNKERTKYFFNRLSVL